MCTSPVTRADKTLDQEYHVHRLDFRLSGRRFVEEKILLISWIVVDALSGLFSEGR